MIEIRSLGQLLSLIHDAKKVTLVEFFGETCGPCQQIKPEYERMAQYMDPAKINVCRCSCDRNRECAARFSIQAVPTFMIFVGGEAINTIRGGDLGAVQRAADMATALLPQHGAHGMPMPGQASGGATVDANAPRQNDFAEKMMLLAAAVAAKDLIGTKEHADAAYTMLTNHNNTSSSNTSMPVGLLLLPYLASDACRVDAVEALFKNMDLRPSPDNLSASLVVEEMMRYLVEVVATLCGMDFDEVRFVHNTLRAMIRCPSICSRMMASCFFDHPFADTGMELERYTLLGGLFGLGLSKRMPIFIPSQRATMEWQSMIKLFPPEEKEKHPEIVFQLQEAITVMTQLNVELVQHLLKVKESRQPTMRFLARALLLNTDYAKTMHDACPISSRFFMVQLQAVLLEVATPMFSSSFDFARLPPSYLLVGATEHGGALVGLGEDVERILHFDDEHPLPQFPAQAEPFRPVVNLFFLATRALMLCATNFIEDHRRAESDLTHPQISEQQRAASTALARLMEVLLEAPKLSSSRLFFTNQMALWLLHVMQVRADGSLPEEPSMAWNYLPQQLIDTTIRASQMAQLEDGCFVDGLISLTLVLMGNTTYFPKAHTHALFPDFMHRLLHSSSETRRRLQSHPWYAACVLRSSIRCYIAVEKSSYEKVQVRYLLALAIKDFLAEDALCHPVREEMENEDRSSMMERFSHMAVAEVNDAVEQMIQTLTKMNQMMKSGADLSESARAPRAGSHGAPGSPNNSNSNNNNNNNRGGSSGANDEEDEEEEEQEGEQTYHGLGLSLRNYILLFHSSMDMFIQLSMQFQRGVSQNLVAQQISQMLALSLVAFAGPKSGQLRIEHSEKYGFRPREILGKLVDCITHFRRSKNFLRCLCACGVPLADIQAAMEAITRRSLTSDDLLWKISEMSAALTTLSKEVDQEEALWDDAPDYALDALLSTPLTDPVALPSEVKDLENLIYVNRNTLHHVLLSEPKNPFTKEYLDEEMVEAFNAREEVKKAREGVVANIAAWLDEAKAAAMKK